VKSKERIAMNCDTLFLHMQDIKMHDVFEDFGVNLV